MRTTTVLFIAGLLLLASCSTTPDSAAAGQRDSDLEQAIKAKLNSDPLLHNANLAVSANATRNEATLSGTLPSEDLRLKAVELAKSAQPNLVLTDKLEVRPPQASRSDYSEDTARTTREKAKELGDKIGRSLDDAWPYSKITARLAADPDTSVVKINVDVTDKVVTLRGSVQTATAKTEAERLARDTEGVAAVHNQLTVAPAG